MSEYAVRFEYINRPPLTSPGERRFTGDDACQEAHHYFEWLKFDRGIARIWIVRNDGKEWLSVEPPLIRDDSGQWVTE